MINAKLSELRPGDKLETDAGFSCMDANVHVVQADDHGLFIPCSHGKHYLVGQLDEDNDSLIGMFTPEVFNGHG